MAMKTYLISTHLMAVIAASTSLVACSGLFEEKTAIKTAETERVVKTTPNDGDAVSKKKRSIEMPAALIGRADTEIRLDNDFAYARVKMEGGKGAHNSVAVQADYPSKTINLTQGFLGAEKTDTFTQNLANTELDVVVVVDNSGSMGDEHQKVATQLPALLSKIQGTKWRIAIVNTDLNSSIPCYVLKHDDVYPKVEGSKTFADAAAEFNARVVSQGINGSGDEQGIAAAMKAWGSKCPAGWYRNNSAIATLIVSDEDECSSGYCDPNKLRPGQLGALYESMGRVTAKSARTYGIYFSPSHTQTMCRTGAAQANIYQKAVTEHGGTWGSICDATYDSTFATISNNLSVILQSQMKLSYVPDMQQLFEVKVNGNIITADKYERNGDLLTFKPGHIPPEGAVVTVRYNHGSVPTKSEFDLGNNLRFEDAKVLINDAEVPAAAYTLSNAAGMAKITFAQKPADNAKIRVIVKENTALSKTFGIGTKVIPGTLEVSKNGVKVAATDYTVDYVNGTVTFNAAPERLANLAFSMYRVEAPRLDYPFVLVEGTAAPEIRDVDTDAVVRAEFKDGKVIFHEEEFRPNRIIEISYQFRNAQGQTINLPYAPIAQSVLIKSAQLECSAGAGQVTVVGSTLKISGDCDLGAGVIKISADFVIERYQSFDFSDLRSKAEIKVFVDNKEVTNYSRDGRKISFAAPLDVYSVVRVDEME